MSEKMKQDQIILNAIAEIMRDADCKFSTEMIDLVESLASAASPAQKPVTTEPVAWQWWTKIGLINMTSSRSEAESWRTKDADVRPLYAIPAPPQPGRDAVIEERRRCACIRRCARMEASIKRALESLCGDYPSMANDLRTALTRDPK